MINLVIQEGATDVIIPAIWVDKTTGEYVNVAHDTAGISIDYVRRGFVDVNITLSAGTDPDVGDDAHSDGQIIHVKAGLHRLDAPDAAFGTGMAAGQKYVQFVGTSDDYEMLPVNVQLSAGVPGGPVDVGSISGDATAADTLELFAEALDQATGQLDSGSLANGTITAASIADNAIAAAKIAANAIAAAKIAADAIAAIQSGLATASALTTVGNNVNTLLGADVVVKKNVARPNNMVYLEASDGSPATGKTVTAEISKDTGAFAALAGAVAEVSDGWYKFDLAQAELNADTVALIFNATGTKQRNLLILTQS